MVPNIANESILSASSFKPSISRCSASWKRMGGSSIVMNISGLKLGRSMFIDRVDATPPMMNAIVGGTFSLQAIREIIETRINMLKKESKVVKGPNFL